MASTTKPEIHNAICALTSEKDRATAIVNMYRKFEHGTKQGVALTGRNRTGPPRSVGCPTAPAAGPAAADRPRARQPACPPAA